MPVREHPERSGQSSEGQRGGVRERIVKKREGERQRIESAIAPKRGRDAPEALAVKRGGEEDVLSPEEFRLLRKAAKESQPRTVETSRGPLTVFRVQEGDQKSLEGFQTLMKSRFDEDEIDDLSTTAEAAFDDGTYAVIVAKNTKQEVVGLTTAATYPLLQRYTGEGQKQERFEDNPFVLLWPYIAVRKDFEKRTHDSLKLNRTLKEMALEEGRKAAQTLGMPLRGLLAEAARGEDGLYSRIGAHRAFIKTTRDRRECYKEIPYWQPPTEFDEETLLRTPLPQTREELTALTQRYGVPLRLVLAPATQKEATLPAEECMGMIRAMFTYNSRTNIPNDFQREAHERANRFVTAYEEDLERFLEEGGGAVYILSPKERKELQQRGALIEEHKIRKLA